MQRAPAFACAAGATAADGSGRNGVFTASLLRHLGRPGVDVDFMLGDVAGAVEEVTGGEQTPFRNHNLKGRRPCCLLTASDAAPAAAVAPQAAAAASSIEAELTAFLAGCRLDAGQQTEAAAALRGIGVTSASHLDLCDEDDLKQLSVPPVVLKLLRKALAERAAQAGGKTEEAEALKRIAAAAAAKDTAAIVAQMKAHASNAAVLAQACDALQALIEKSGDERAKAGAAGAIEALAAAVKTHTANGELLTHACRVLIFLTARKADAANRERAVAAGAIDAVMAATMPPFNNAALVSKVVVDTVGSLDQRQHDVSKIEYGHWVHDAIYKRQGVNIYDGTAEELDKNAVIRNISKNMIDVVVAALKATPKDSPLHCWAAYAFQTICCLPSQKQYARDNDAVSLLHEASRNHPSECKFEDAIKTIT